MLYPNDLVRKQNIMYCLERNFFLPRLFISHWIENNCTADVMLK